jgi:hypothetical protein
MQSEMKGDVYMKLQGVMAEVIMKLDPKKYKKYAIQEGGHDAIYVKLIKALYGILPGRSPFLAEPVNKITGMGIRDQPLRLLSGQQGN